MNEKYLIDLFLKLVGEESPARLLFHELAHDYGVPADGHLCIPVPANTGSFSSRKGLDMLLDPQKVHFPGVLRLEWSNDIVSCALFQYHPRSDDWKEPVVKLVSGASTMSVHSNDQMLHNKLVFQHEMLYAGAFTKILPLFVAFITRAEELIRPYPVERCNYDTFVKARAMLA